MNLSKISWNQGMKIGLKCSSYGILVVLFYVFYMKDSLEKYQKGITTMGERQEEIKHDDPRFYPIIIICPEPGFKTSYFDERKIPTGMKKFFWKNDKYLKNIDDDIVNTYENMSYKLGTDWNIHVWSQG